jgi:hypothetical protein
MVSAMMLFPSLHGTPSSPKAQEIETPLGSITSGMSIDSTPVTTSSPSTSLMLQDDGWCQQWVTPQGTVAQLCCRPTMLRAYWEQVQDCWAILWRAHFTHAVEQVICETTWISQVSNYEGGPDSGEGLEAQTWYTPTTILSLGTEGEDMLFIRAQGNDRLPQRLLTHARPELGILPLVQYNEQGLSIMFTELEADEEIQVHFVIAWSNNTPDSIATWNAVNLSASQILKGAMGNRFDTGAS